MLQCYASQNTKLGIEILELLNPDNDALPMDHLLQGNLRFLYCYSNDDDIDNDYSTSTTIRNEAISRVLYILSIHKDSNLYLPKINYITDVIPNDICIIENIIDPLKNIVNDYGYEVLVNVFY